MDRVDRPCYGDGMSDDGKDGSYYCEGGSVDVKEGCIVMARMGRRTMDLRMQREFNEAAFEQEMRVENECYN